MASSSFFYWSRANFKEAEPTNWGSWASRTKPAESETIEPSRPKLRKLSRVEPSPKPKIDRADHRLDPDGATREDVKLWQQRRVSVAVTAEGRRTNGGGDNFIRRERQRLAILFRRGAAALGDVIQMKRRRSVMPCRWKGGGDRVSEFEVDSW
jgi:hypothetical protein